MEAREVLGMYWDIERRLGETLAGGKRDKWSGLTREDGSYIMVPFHPMTFVEILTTAAQMRKRKGQHTTSFVDVGAGAGFKVFIAERMGYEATGIEYDKKYVDFGRDLLGLTGEDWSGKLIHEDGMKATYKNFDIIYFYRPIKEREGQKKLEERILSTMRDDAIVIGIMAETFHEKMQRVPYRTPNYYADILWHKRGCEKHFNLEKVKTA